LEAKKNEEEQGGREGKTGKQKEATPSSELLFFGTSCVAQKRRRRRRCHRLLLLLFLQHKEEEEANVVCGATLQRYVSCAAQLHKQTNKINTKKKCLPGSCVGPAPAAPSSKLAPAPSWLQAPSSLPLNVSGALVME
jgi:hypothetical protein